MDEGAAGGRPTGSPAERIGEPGRELVDGTSTSGPFASTEEWLTAGASSERSSTVTRSTDKRPSGGPEVTPHAIVRTVGADQDRDVLRAGAYGEPSKLAARQALWTYADRTFESGRITWATSLAGDETVVDVGCGNGKDLGALRADGHRGRMVAVDFSPGMVITVPVEVAERVVGDALALPLADGIADVVCELHMLYHVPDIPAALREARRVLADGGTFLVSTNSEHAMVELVEPWSAAMVAAGGPPLQRASHEAFSLENGGRMLGDVFGSVDVTLMEVTARIPSPDVVRAYVASTDDLYRPMLPDDGAWEQVLDAVADHASRVIDRAGTFDVVQRAGMFVCRP